MIKRSIILSINDPLNTNELAMKVQSVTDGSSNVIIESVAQRVTVDTKDLKQAIEEAIEFTEKHKLSNAVASQSVQVVGIALETGLVSPSIINNVEYGEDESSNS